MPNSLNRVGVQLLFPAYITVAGAAALFLPAYKIVAGAAAVVVTPSSCVFVPSF